MVDRKKLLAYLILSLLFLSMIPLFSPSVGASDMLFEYQTGESLSDHNLGGVHWCSQTFTIGTVGTNINHNITSVSLLLKRNGLPGTITVSIRATNITGYPTGVNLTWGTTDGNTLTTDSYGEWREIIFTTKHALLSSTTYAIIVKTTGAYESLKWKYRNHAGAYAGGRCYESGDSGVTWAQLDIIIDCAFKEYGFFTPSVITNSATLVTKTTATLNGVASGTDGFTCGFWYNTTGTNTNVTCAGTYNNNIPFSKDITGLTPGAYYTVTAWSYKAGIGFYFSSTPTYFLTIPYPPSLPTVTATGNNLTIKWTNFTQQTGVTRYTMVRYSTSSYPTGITSGSLLINTTTVNTTKIYYFTPGLTYYFSMWTFCLKTGVYQWSSTYNTTSIEAPTHPIGLTLTGFNDTTIGLSWTPGTEDTVVVRNSTGYPPTANNGTKIYNGTASTVTDTGLLPSHKYYYRAWNWNGTAYSTGYTNVSQYTKPHAPTNMDFKIASGSTWINITWVNGTGSQKTRLQRSTTPINNPTDGTMLYNGTNQYYNMTPLTQPYYFTAFSWNTTTGYYSNGSNLTWYVVWVNCYDDNNGTAIPNFRLFMTNPSGTDTYSHYPCNNPFLINISSCPQGEDISIIVNATGYNARTYIQDIVITGNYYINAYLPHTETPMPTNETYLYRLTVNNEISQPVENAYVQIKKQVNNSAFQTVYTLYTDAGGNIFVWLTAGQLYIVNMSKTGYITGLSHYTPNDQVFTQIFILKAEGTIPQPPIISAEEIHFNVELSDDNTTMWANYTDDSNYTEWTTLVISCFNYTTFNWSTIGWDNTTNMSSWSTITPGRDNNSDYYFNLTYHNTYLGTVHMQIVIEADKHPVTTPEHVRDVFSWIGVVPFGIQNVLMWLMFIAVCYNADERDAGKFIIVFGVICIFLSSWVGFISENALTIGGGIGLGILFIIIGFLMERGHK